MKYTYIFYGYPTHNLLLPEKEIAWHRVDTMFRLPT